MRWSISSKLIYFNPHAGFPCFREDFFYQTASKTCSFFSFERFICDSFIQFCIKPWNYTEEYVIYNKDTPTPWSNIIANKNFGTIVTNNGCGYTYAYNSGEFKITSWTNEMVLNDKSEGIKINNSLFF